MVFTTSTTGLLLSWETHSMQWATGPRMDGNLGIYNLVSENVIAYSSRVSFMLLKCYHSPVFL